MAFCSSENNNSQHKTPRVTPLGVFCFSQCFRVFPTDRVPHGDSLFAERISVVRSHPASSPPTPPKSPLQLSVSLLNTPLRVHNHEFPGTLFRQCRQLSINSASVTAIFVASINTTTGKALKSQLLVASKMPAEVPQHLRMAVGFQQAFLFSEKRSTASISMDLGQSLLSAPAEALSGLVFDAVKR